MVWISELFYRPRTHSFSRIGGRHNLATIHHWHAPNDHIGDARRGKSRFLLSRAVDYGGGIEQGKIGIRANLHPAFVAHGRGNGFEPLRRQQRHLA